MLNRTTNRVALFSAVSVGVLATLTVIAPSAVSAQTAPAERPNAQGAAIDLPAMPMAEALQAIAARGGETINYDPDAVKGLTSHPVHGVTNAKHAVQMAIQGTGLTVLPGSREGLVVVSDIVVTARRDEAETSVLVRQATTSDRSGLGLRDQPRNTQVITAKTIEEQQALDITDILRNAGGVSSSLNNTNAGASYTVRGFYAAGLVNGLSGGSQYGVSAGANQPVANIERVEVLKGPDAILSGFNNLGGNVNVVTKKPSAEQRLAVSFDTGSWGLVRGVLDANNAITADKKLSGRVIASAQTMDRNYGGYTGNEDYLFAPSLRYKDRLTDIVIGASLSQSKTGLSAYTLFNRGTRQIIDRDPSVPIYSPGQYLNANIDRYYFDATRQITPDIELVARGMHDRSTLVVHAGSLGYSRAGVLNYAMSGSAQRGTSDAIDSFVRIKTHFGDVLKASFNIGYNYSSGNTTQSSGSQYIQVFNPPLGANTSVPVQPFPALGAPYITTKGKQEGVYGQALFEVWKFKLLGGVRKNWFETQNLFVGASPSKPSRKNGVTPNAGAIYDATDWLSVFANYSRGEQAVFTAGEGGIILPNIKTKNKEAGVKLDLFRKHATINASYFDMMQDNTIVFDQVTRLARPGPGQRGRGIDLNVTGQLLRGWTVLGSFTRTNYKLLTTTATQNTVAFQPRDTYSLYSSYRTRLTDKLSGGVAAGLYGRSSSYADSLGQYVVPESHQVDVNGFLSIAGFDVNLGVRNVFNRRNYSPTSVYTYVPVSEPRNVRLSLTKRLF